MSIEPQTLGFIFFTCLTTLGAIGVVTGRGMNPDATIQARIAITLYISGFFLILVFIHCAIGSFDFDNTSLLGLVWTFVGLPLYAALSILGLGTAGNIINEYGEKIATPVQRSNDSEFDSDAGLDAISESESNVDSQ